MTVFITEGLVVSQITIKLSALLSPEYPLTVLRTASCWFVSWAILIHVTPSLHVFKVHFNTLSYTWLSLMVYYVKVSWLKFFMHWSFPYFFYICRSSYGYCFERLQGCISLMRLRIFGFCWRHNTLLTSRESSFSRRTPFHGKMLWRLYETEGRLVY